MSYFYSIVSYLYVSCSGGDERVSLSGIVCLFLFLCMLGIGCVTLL